MKITYQVLKLNNKNNYRRILGDIRKIQGIENVRLNKERNIIHIEYNNIDDLKDRLLKCFNYYEKQVDLEEVVQTEVYRKVLPLSDTPDPARGIPSPPLPHWDLQGCAPDQYRS